MVSLLRKALPYLTVATIIAAAYDGWFFYSRWRDARESREAAKAHESEEARRTIDMLGGGQLKILSFYPSPAAIRRGDHANICYGVYGAKSVRIDPPVEELHPAVAHCLQVTPSRSTEYRLVAEDGSGHSASQRFVLRVAP
jgi:hypothetical protein